MADFESDIDRLKAAATNPIQPQALLTLPDAHQGIARPNIPTERVGEMRDYLQAEAALKKTSEQPVDFGPLPDEVQAKLDAEKAAAEAPKTKSPFDTKARREATELGCSEMDFGDLVLHGRVQQDVPVLKGRLNVRYQSLLGRETYWLERSIGNRRESVMSTSAWLTYTRLALSVAAINNRETDPVLSMNKLTNQMEIDDVLVEARLQKLLQMGDRIIELLMVNQSWFEDRYQKLFDDDFQSVKNG